jgi:hypothetical protein
VESDERLGDEFLYFLEFGSGNKVKSFAVESGEINAVQDTLIEVGKLFNFFGKEFEGGDHLGISFSLHNDDDFVAVAEFVNIVEPEFVETAIGIDEVEPTHFEFDVSVTPIEAGSGEKESRNQHRSGKPATEKS